MSTSTPQARVAAAQEQAAAARLRLGDTVGELKARISPQNLGRDAIDTIRERGTALATGLAGSVRREPATAAAVAGGLVLFLARRPLLALLRRATGAHSKSLPSKAPSQEGSAI